MEARRLLGRALLVVGALALPSISPARAGDDAVPPPAPSASTPDAGTTAPAPPSTPAEVLAARRRVRALFFDTRGRGPTAAERDALIGIPHEAAVDRLLAQPEAWDAWLERECFYYLLIDRFRPVSDRVRALPARLAAREATVLDATREIVVSAEFNARNPGNDTFVTVVLEQLLGVVVQAEPAVLAAGKRMYDGYAARLYNEVGRSQSDIVKIVLSRRAFADRFVERQYRAVFGKAASKEVVARDAARLHADPACWPAVLREWLVSDEWRARARIPRPKGDQVFLRTLFVDILGREPTFDEFRNSRNAFQALSDPAPVRNVLAGLLVDSPSAKFPSKAELTRPADFVKGLFLDLLGREPTQKEVDAFVATLGEYGCEPKTLVLALVTSPEYQYY